MYLLRSGHVPFRDVWLVPQGPLSLSWFPGILNPIILIFPVNVHVVRSSAIFITGYTHKGSRAAYDEDCTDSRITHISESSKLKNALLQSTSPLSLAKAMYSVESLAMRARPVFMREV